MVLKKGCFSLCKLVKRKLRDSRSSRNVPISSRINSKMDAAKMIVVMGDMDAEMEKESCTAYESRRYV